MFSDEVWDVLVATEIIPTYKDSIFLTVDDAIAAANVPTPAPDELTLDDKVWRSCCLFIKPLRKHAYVIYYIISLL